MRKLLPISWKSIPLGNIVSKKKGKKPKNTIDYAKEGFYPYILIHEMEGGIIRNYTNDPKVPIVEKNEVLLVWDGSIGKCTSGIQGAIGSTLVAIRPLGEIPTKFIEYFIKSKHNYILENSTGTGLQHINKNFFKDCIIDLPPLSEQERMVAKLDVLFERLDRLKKSLAKIPDLLQNFRQEVLMQSVSGKMTEEWREGQQNDAIDLQTLEKNREDLKRANALTRGKKSYNHKISVLPDVGNRSKGIDNLFEIPSSWHWVSLDQVLWNISDGPHFSPNYVHKGEGKRFISMRNVSFNKIDFSDSKYVSEKDHSKFIERGKPEQGDLLYTKGGTTGIPCLIENDTDFSYWVHLALLKPINKFIISKYLRNALASSLCYNQSQALTHGVSNQDLGLTRMIYICLPLPPLQEQQEIVNRVEILFDKADKIQEKYEYLKSKIDQLPQTILHKAFKGELVPQLESDGDTSELLEKIRNLKTAIK